MAKPKSYIKHLRRFGAGALLSLGTTMPVMAEGPSLGGEISIQGRWFAETPAFVGQSDEVQASLAFEPDLGWETADGRHQVSFRGFLRSDSVESRRSHADLREGYYRYSDGDWDIVAGFNQVFWGVTESRHLVNVVNQIDALEDIDDESFLGQPMLQIGRETGIGRFDLFVLPGFREREFPGVEGRLRTVLPVDTSAATYESADGNDHVDVALRYSHYFDDVDVGVHLFHGTSREPMLAPDGGGEALIPHYPIITQAGVDLQYTHDAWLWKLEAMYREGQGKSFGAAVAGVEYTLYQLGGGDADLGLIAELTYDGRDASAFPTIYDQDVFLGGRLALNDTADTAILAGLLTDVDRGPTAFRIEASRRLGDNWSFDVIGQVFLQDDPGDPAQAFERDGHLTLQLSRHF